jgi:hypothetical protein
MSSQQLAPVAARRAETHSSSTRLRDSPTQHFDAVRCLSSRETRKALDGEAIPHGSYLLAPGTNRALLIPLDGPMTHLGRGLKADLYLVGFTPPRDHPPDRRGASDPGRSQPERNLCERPGDPRGGALRRRRDHARPRRAHIPRGVVRGRVAGDPVPCAKHMAAPGDVGDAYS